MDVCLGQWGGCVCRVRLFFVVVSVDNHTRGRGGRGGGSREGGMGGVVSVVVGW